MMITTALLNKNRQPRRRRFAEGAFTLVELLVVLALVGVLVALLLPALDRAVAHSRQAKCASNLRQIWGGINLYVADNEVYPWAQYDENPTGEKLWATTPTLGRYLGGAGTNKFWHIFVCPEHKGGYATKGSRSYSANKFVMYLEWSKVTQGKSRVRPGQIPRPSEVVLIGDGLLSEQANGAPVALLKGPINYNNPDNRENLVRPGPGSEIKDYEPIDSGLEVYLSYRHSGKAAVVFCDGHVEAWPIGSFKQKNFSIDY